MKQLFLLTMLAALSTSTTFAQRQMEYLDRGVVAIHQGEGNVFISWRLLGSDPEDVAFHVHRQSGDHPPIRITQDPVTGGTWLQDRGVDVSHPVTYTVTPHPDTSEHAPPGTYTLTPDAVA